MKLKIGRHEYDITENDIFLDNGCCVQLITQSKEPVRWGHQPHPVLSKVLGGKLKKNSFVKIKEASCEYTKTGKLIYYKIKDFNSEKN